ncbi:MAG: hypothetical protein L6Q99_12825 [Planctomycetes bacterium]|nr:hypothetical protein [Planctomycetota bacterium]
MKLLVCLCAAVAACAPEVPQAVTDAQRVEAAPSAFTAALGSEARFGTAPHEAIDASVFVGAFEAQFGEVIEFREDGTYGARLDGRLSDGVWYAFGAHVELDEITSSSSDRGFDLVAVDDELVLVPDDRLSKLVVDVRSGLELSREWLRRTLPAGAPRPDLPPPFNEVARMRVEIAGTRAAAVELAEWRGTYRAQTMESREQLVIDESGNFHYERSGCWWESETGAGRVAAFGDLLLLTCEARTSPYVAEHVLFAPLRRGARRFIVPCDAMWDVALLHHADGELLEQFHLHDDAKPDSEVWGSPRAFERWLAGEPTSARITKIRATGPETRLVSVVTLDVGRKHGAFRRLLLSSAEGRGEGLRVVLVRESDCDAVLTDADDEGASLSVGAVFRAETF